MNVLRVVRVLRVLYYGFEGTVTKLLLRFLFFKLLLFFSSHFTSLGNKFFS